MVLHQRRTSSNAQSIPSISSLLTFSSEKTSLIYGDGRKTTLGSSPQNLSESSSPASDSTCGPLSPTFFGSPTNYAWTPDGTKKVFFSAKAAKFDEIDTRRRRSIKLLSCVILSVFIACFVTFYVRELRVKQWHLEAVKSELEETRLSEAETAETLANAEASLASLEASAAELETTKVSLQSEFLSATAAEARNVNPKVARDEIHGLMRRRQEALKERVDILTTELGRISKREALERFGSGPHHVQFTIAFGANSSKEKSTFTLEMAPLDLMPHSVNMFLQMVSNKLWDNTVFQHSAHHILQASPIELGSGENKRKEFEDASLAQVSFQEYSDKYPHEKYTVGFAGRPGGPDFYISTQDNSDIHGPGGQDHYDTPGEADPCFARVFSGQDVIDRMQRLSNESSIGMANSDLEGHGITVTQIIEARIV